MSTYQTLKGLKVKFLDSATSGDRAKEGEIFYNSSGPNIASHIAVASVSSGTSMITGRNAMGTSTSTGASAFAAGGNPNDTEHYDGSGWSEGTALNTSRRYLAGCGTLTAGLVFGGNKAPLPTLSGDTEEYDGSTWTESGDLNTVRQFMSRAGTQTAALAAGGTAGPGQVNNSEEYNGTSWAEGDNLNTTRSYFSGCGTQTAGLCVAGATPGGNSALVEEYDGTSWSEQGNVNTARQIVAAAGPQTAAVSAGGKISSTSLSTAIEEYDGSAHSTSPATLTTGRNAAGGSGDSSNMVIFGGGSQPGQTSHTEEFNKSIFTRTAGVWSSGANFPEKTTSGGGAGPVSAAISFGGNPPSAGNLNKSFEYNGTAWSDEATLSDKTAGSLSGQTGFGTQTAAVACADNAGGPPYTYVATIEYDGSSWSNGEDRPADRYSAATCGILTAGLTFGGRATPGPGGSFAFNTTLEYDGTDWTAAPNMNTGRDNFNGSGTQTAALGGGGYSSVPNKEGSHTEEYDGSSWTNSNNQLYDTRMAKQSGTQTDTLSMGSLSPGPSILASTMRYDGTSWSTNPSMATGRYNQHVGTQATVGTTWGAAGYVNASPNRGQTTEHFNEETLAATAKTIDFD